MEQNIEKHFLKAQEAIQESEALIASGLYKASIGRSYNAMMQAITAVIQANKIRNDAKRNVYSIIDENFIKTGRLNKKFMNYLREADHARVDSGEISATSIEFRQAQMIMIRTREFIEECRKLCQ